MTHQSQHYIDLIVFGESVTRLNHSFDTPFYEFIEFYTFINNFSVYFLQLLCNYRVVKRYDHLSFLFFDFGVQVAVELQISERIGEKMFDDMSQF